MTTSFFRSTIDPNFGFNRPSVGNPFNYIPIERNFYIGGTKYSTIPLKTPVIPNYNQLNFEENKIGLKTNPNPAPMTNAFNLNTASVRTEEKNNPYYNPNNYPQRMDNVKDLMNYTYNERTPKFELKSIIPSGNSYTPYAVKTRSKFNEPRANSISSRVPISSRIPKIDKNNYANSLINNYHITDNYNKEESDNNQLTNNEGNNKNNTLTVNRNNRQIINGNTPNNLYASRRMEEMNNEYPTDPIVNTQNDMEIQQYGKMEEILSDDSLKEYFKECRGGIVKDYAYYEDIGKRDYMEDQGKAVENFNGDPNQILFCLYDGHGGTEVSKFLRDNLQNYLKEMLPFENYPKGFYKLFKKLDEEVKSLNVPDSGSTASVAYIERKNGKRFLHCACIGDSRCILIRKSKDKAIRLSIDDRVENPDEHKRVIKQGGVIFNGRIYGTLMLSRCFGDWGIKEYGVVANPHVASVELTNDDLFLIMATDGVWDALTDDECKSLTNSSNNSLEICKNIVEEAFIKGSDDNTSCFVIRL